MAVYRLRGIYISKDLIAFSNHPNKPDLYLFGFPRLKKDLYIVSNTYKLNKGFHEGLIKCKVISPIRNGKNVTRVYVYFTSETPSPEDRAILVVSVGKTKAPYPKKEEIFSKKGVHVYLSEVI